MKDLITNCWNAVMDDRRNPLRHLDLPSQQYFPQLPGWMWSMVFSLAFLAIFQSGGVRSGTRSPRGRAAAA